MSTSGPYGLSALGTAALLLAAISAGNAWAQTAAPAPSGGPTGAPAGSSVGGGGAMGAPIGGTVGADPSPYYLGASQSFTHESNAARSSSGSSSSGDTVSSTTLFGGFDQPIGRQRVFGRGDIAENRYFSNSSLNNTSYNLSAGADFATIGDLTGGIVASANQNRAAPITFTPLGSIVPTTSSNLARTKAIDGRIAWGGSSLLSIDATAGHSKVDYSSPAYATSNLTQDRASIGFHVSPGSSLRLGLALRESRTQTPQAVPVTTTGGFESNTTTSRNIDFLADYRLSGIVSSNLRLSQTRQTNSNALLAGGDFSGLTGSLNVNYAATGKTSFSASVARDVGFNSSLLNTYSYTQVGIVTIVSPLTGLYQSNQVTNSVSLAVAYAATAKITANAGVRYARARSLSNLSSTGLVTTLPPTTDASTLLFLNANWAVERNWGVYCNVSHETRSVSGGVGYDYTNDSIGCGAQYTWR